MKSKTLLQAIAICASHSLLVASLLAANANNSSSSTADSSSLGQGAPATASSSDSSTGSSHMSHRSERLSQLMGTTVKNAQGETLGQINDFVINPMSGRIQFAIISLSDPSQSGKLTAVPWTLARMSTEPNTVMLNVDKQKLASSQTFDATSWPDFSQADWTQKTYSYYGVQEPSWRGTGGRIPMDGNATGTSSSKDRDAKPNADNGTAPDGRGTFNQGPDVNPDNQATPNNREKSNNP
ncbi:PRC-barrel domain-containing protein [Pedosphaera parvula]|uniref:PRC-barrel domain protein n=1 Tax=Pedosphaera parvula (strain Ellin514) TaxID=320771 RepID=B9XC99_PEDPL|nr:PRC-barrel domain-containing protein [Pedosphaera parvula]EEF62567.1 PRC-barrel domain protein [Pedosphaera parvula Ellin514]